MNVSAIIVTRGDVDLNPILDSLPPAWETLIYDNGAGDVILNGRSVTTHDDSGDPEVAGQRFAQFPDVAVYGRYAAIAYASHDLLYVQDDDVIVSDPQAIVDALWEAPCQTCAGLGRAYEGSNIACPSCLTWGTAYAAGEVVCNMPQEFRPHYTDSALVGFGAAFHRDAPEEAFATFHTAVSLGEISAFHTDVFERTCDVVFTALTPRVLVDVPKTNLPWAEDESRMYRQPGHVEERTRMLELARKVRDS